MHNLKKWVGFGLTLLLCFCISIINSNAASKQSSENAACEKAIYSGDMISFDSSDSTTYRFKVYAKNGTWDIKWYVDDDLEDGEVLNGAKTPTGTYTYKGGETYNIIVNKKDFQQKIIVTAIAKGDSNGHVIDKNGSTLRAPLGNNNTTTCKAVGSISIDNSNKISITNTAAYAKKTVKALSTKAQRTIEANSPEEKECAAMQQGKFYTDLSKTSEFDNTDGTYWNMIKNSFPYCNGSYNSSFEISAKTIKKVRQSSLKAYKSYSDFQSDKNNNAEYVNAEKEINDTNNKYNRISYDNKGLNVGTLKCPSTATTDTTERFYTRHQEVSNNLCKVTCQEQFQVTYSPPVAVKAGLCFQYQVTVKSRVTCKTVSTGNISWPQAIDDCEYSPICDADASETQAGPNEQFDSCINSCDNGKYSQTCINKCYKEVYEEKKSSTKSSVTNTNNDDTMSSNNIIQLANNSNDIYYSDSKCNTNNEIKANAEYCANFFYKLKKSYPLGYYKEPKTHPSWYNYKWYPCYSSRKDNEQCKFEAEDDEKKKYLSGDYINSYVKQKTTNTPSEDNWVESVKRSSPYYFRTKSVALKTIQSFFGVANGRNGYGEDRKYVIDDRGIKRQRTSTYNCHETCGFTKDSGSNSCKSSNKEIEKYYVEKYDSIEASLSKCTQKAKCKTGESTFNINIDYNQENKSDTQTQDYGTDTNKTSSDESTGCSYGGSTGMFVPIEGDKEPNADGINGKCYCRDNSSYWQHYKTTITIPGSWINLKTGEVIYSEPQSSSTSEYRTKKYYFCTPYNIKEVNTIWWKWKVNGTGDGKTVEKNDNIKAKITSFGKYNWSLNINCFYAVYNKTIDNPLCYRGNEGVSENCNTSDEGKKEMSTKLNYDIRVADTTNLFPNNRLRGYNWGSAAQLKSNDSTISKALQNTGYGVDPVDYSKAVIAQGEKVYDQKADLVINLDADTNIISDIKKLDLDLGGKYTEVKDIPGLYYYTMSDDLKSLLSKTNSDWSSWDNIKGINSKTAVENVKK